MFYGTSPETLVSVQAPVLGLYGGEDNRVGATIADAEADAEMKRLGKPFEKEIYEGAGHGFLRQQDRMNNKAAADQAWVRTVAFFKKNLEARMMMNDDHGTTQHANEVEVEVARSDDDMTASQVAFEAPIR